jgi:hypothetical protein
MSEDEGMTDRECWCKLYGHLFVDCVKHYDWLKQAVTDYHNNAPTLYSMVKKVKRRRYD